MLYCFTPNQLELSKYGLGVNMSFYIYALVDPDTNQIRYIGMSLDPRRRLRQHMRETKKNAGKNIWIDGLKARRRTPYLLILETVAIEADPFERERWWIGFGHYSGWPLTNWIPDRVDLIFRVDILRLAARILADEADNLLRISTDNETDNS